MRKRLAFFYFHIALEVEPLVRGPMPCFRLGPRRLGRDRLTAVLPGENPADVHPKSSKCAVMRVTRCSAVSVASWAGSRSGIHQA
jgi:hypothetical protein